MSTIARLFAEKPCVFSIECFPPKQTTRFAAMQQTLRSMKQLSPDFISVTYGAGGSAGGVSSVQVAEFLQNELGILPLAHTLCMGWRCGATAPRCGPKARIFTTPAT